MTRHLPEAERGEQILRSARAIFVERGYRAARVEDVARRARLSKGAVYFYFKSKRELFDALVMEEQEQMMQFLEEAASDKRPATVRLLELGIKYLDYFTGRKSPPRFFLLMSEMAIRDDELRASVAAVHQRFIDQAAALIRDGVEEGSFRDLDPVAVATMLKAMVDGLAGQSAIGIRPDKERLSADGFQFILLGLADPTHLLAQE